MTLNAWTNLLGVTQGRLAPVGYTPTEGSNALVLGSDVTGVKRRLQGADRVEVKQTADLGGSTILRFNARTRGPLQLPTLVDVSSAAASTYTITLNGTALTFVASVTDTTVSIAQALVTRINFATVTSKNTEPYVMATGQSITFNVEGSARVVTFLSADFVNIALATSAEVAVVINRLAEGVTASVSGGAVVITSDLQGKGSKLDNFSGTALSILGFVGASDTRTVPVQARIAGNGDALQLDADDPDVTFTTTVVGNLVVGTFLWKAKLLIGAVTYFEQTIRSGRTRDRVDGGVMVRNLAAVGGTHELVFRLELEATIAGTAVEVELPAFYVDNITLDIFTDDPLTGFIANIVDWWRSDAPPAGALSTWVPRVGSESIIVNTGEAPAPVINVSGGSNNQPYLDFDGTQAAHAVDATVLDQAGPVTSIAIVSDTPDDSTLRHLMTKGEITAHNYGIGLSATNDARGFYDGADSSNGQWITDDKASVAIITQQAARTDYRINGVVSADVVARTLTQNNESLFIGGLYTGVFPAGAYSDFWIGRLYDLLILSAQPSTFESLRIEGYREARYLP